MIGEEKICLPIAGIISITLMFGVSQLKTMATPGRTVSTISLLALIVVVIQCLVAIRMGGTQYEDSITVVKQEANIQEQ